jgi:8-oxo-dGTP diphosphatase
VVVGDDGRVAVVHRPRYDDWSLPKGKLDPGERAQDGAVRETQEETGLTCLVRDYLGRDEYTDHHGRPKVVDYWLMEPVTGAFHPTDEVDELRWLEIQPARALLTYDRDRETLRKGVEAWKESRT